MRLFKKPKPVRAPRQTRKESRPPLNMEALENRECPAAFSVIGATGSPDTILSVKVIDDTGNLAASVQPFNHLTSIRVATGDFDGDGIVDEVAALGRRSSTDLRAEIVTYDMNTDTGALTETGRFDAFAPGVLGNGFITTGDFDGDGDDDIAVAQIGGGSTTVTLQTHMSNGGFSMGGVSQIDFGGVAAPRLAAGDTDNDGMDEIIVAARTDLGADVRVFDADNAMLQPVQQGGFVWDFGVVGYNRGAFVAVGEFDPTSIGQEIVLGSNVGGGGRVDVVNFDGASATLVPNGRFQPFEATSPGYDAAVRVAVGSVNDGMINRNVILAGQDRFQLGQVVQASLDFNLADNQQDLNPMYMTGVPFTVLAAADGNGPADASPTGDTTLGPFVAFANTTQVRARGDLIARDTNDLNMMIAGPIGVTAAGANNAFIIDASRLALPAGATFDDLNNSLVLTVNFLAPAANVLDSLDLDLRYYVDEVTPGININRVELINVTQVDANAVQLTIQISDDALVGLAAATAGGDQLFGHYTSGSEPLDDFFTAASVADLGTGFFVLDVDNNSAQDITLLNWDLAFDFA